MTERNPKIEVKGIKTFMGEDGHGFNATLYVDGIKTAFIVDVACGGEYEYQIHNPQKFAEFEAYVKTLPQLEGLAGIKLDTDRDIVIAELIEFAEAMQKLKKQMKKSILIGQPLNDKIPDNYSYRLLKFKKPLKELPKDILRKHVNETKTKLKDGEVILNTNLAELGISQ